VLSLLTAIAIYLGPETYRNDIHADNVSSQYPLEGYAKET
jgi:hypothetical protein